VTYHYSLLRFVPDPGSGERVNLAVLVGDDQSGDWDMRQISSTRRASAIDVEHRLPTALAFVSELDARLLDPEELTVGEVKLLSEEMNNVVQLTPPRPVIASSATEGLDILFDELLVDPSGPRKVVKKWQAVRSTLDAYREHHIQSNHLQRRPVVKTEPYDIPFDFAVHNGHAVQLVQCWSFQVLGQDELARDIRSWAWGVRALRDYGGTISEPGDGEGLDVGGDVELGVVFVPPIGGSHAYDEATAAFDTMNVKAVGDDAASELAESAVALLGPELEPTT
jgi:hypothetical protein